MLRIENLSKQFGVHRVLSDVDLKVDAGEIHGLVGVNGSGKSTLLNILFGNPVIRDTGGYTGRIVLDGRPVRFDSPHEAIKAGIGMIHQEFALLPDMTVAENIRIGREQVFSVTQRLFGNGFSLVDKKNNIRMAGQALNRLGVSPDPGLLARYLPVHMKQFVEIARETDKDHLKVLLLDEPTSALGPEDAEKLMAILTRLAQKGTAVIYVSHRIEEITGLCHRVTVLRNGRVSGCYGRDRFDAVTITEAMIGHRVVKTRRVLNGISDRPALEFSDFGVKMPGEELENLNMTVYKGEILGVAGLSGHGRAALGAGVMGIFPTSGAISLDNLKIECPRPSIMISKGISLLPEDRRTLGLLMDHSVMDNIVFTAMQHHNKFLKKSVIKALAFPDHRKASSYTKQCVERFDIGCRSIHQKVRELSGGNQQKVCIARCLATSPDILFVNEPTRGVDIAAKERILEYFLDINNGNNTTFVISSGELDELKRICDRIAVFYKGRLLDILSPERDDLDFARAFSGEKV